MIDDYIKLVHTKAALGYEYGCIGLQILLRKLTETYL